MKQIDRKLLRDLWQLKGQSLAISLVIASGVATFVMSLSTLTSLELSQETYYDRYRFAHVFARLKRAPETLKDRIVEIPGVARVQTRIVEDVSIDVPGLVEPAIGRLISVPDRGRPALNDLHLRSGRYLDPDPKGEILVGEAFAEAHGLTTGDSLRAILNGRRQDLTIVGIVLSPEYVLQIREGDLLPDQKRFGVFWMRERELAAAFDMDGAFNSITLQLMRGAPEEEVIQRLDDLTERYGGVGAYGRHDHLSHRFLEDEIKSLRGTGLIAPIIFLGVASFLLNVVIARLVGTQREQIAALKAFGYTKWEVGAHYLKLVLLISVSGVIVGTLLGAWLGQGLTNIYTEFYRFPVFFFQLDFAVVVLALGLSTGSAVLGSLGSVRKAVQLPPAEAMRPEPPATYRPTIIERWGLQRLLTQAARMILRQLERRPFKSMLSSFGISLAVAVLVLGSFMEDAMNYLIEFQFYISQRQDMMVTFVETGSGGVLHEVEHLPGVIKAEPFRSVAVRLRHGYRSRRLGIMAIEPDSDLFKLLDEHEQPVVIPPHGIVLSEKLADLLDVGLGDTLTVEVQEGERPVRDVVVSGLVADFSGTNAYMGVDTLHRLMREGNSISGANLSVDSDKLDTLYTTLKNTPAIAGVSIKDAMIRSFNETVKDNQMQFRMFNIMFACVIAFGVVYNTARISLSERSRELATLRVIGFTRGEISAILLGELAVLTLAAIPVGLALGYGFAAAATWAFNTDLYRIPLVVSQWTFAFATSIVIVASLLSGLIVRRRLDELDLVAVLKSKE